MAAIKTIDVLTTAGFEGYLVGGCVRDINLGRTPKDYDVSTNAVPDEVRALFPKTTPVGAKFGVVVVMMDGQQIEVATYRSDGAYSDGRRPDEVRYSQSAEEDVQRRDFTINGMLMTPISCARWAMLPEDQVNSGMAWGGATTVDYVLGQEDLKNRVIRCIGDPDKRFGEDQLRMLRAVRFAAQLGFTIEEKTWKSIQNRACTIGSVSRERVREELIKILQAPHAVTGIQLLITSGLARHLFGANVLGTLNGETLSRFDNNVSRIFDGPNLALAMFAANMMAGFATEFLQSLKLPTSDFKEILGAVVLRPRMAGMQDFPRHAKVRMMRQPGADLALEMARQDVLMGISVDDQKLSKLQGFYDVTPQERNLVRFVTGEDLIERGMKPDTSFGEILNTMEDMQLDGLFNSRETALRYLDEKRLAP